MFQINVENQDKHFVIKNIFLFSENRAAYEIMWTNKEQLDRPQMKIWFMPVARWVNKATDIHSEY